MARRPPTVSHPGRVVETRGRKVLVRDDAGARDCFLSGQRAVVGDRVRWVEARGSGGKLVAVEPRETVLRRADLKGREQVLAANLAGLLVVTSAREPDFRGALLHRYLVAASRDGLEAILVLSKVDLGVPPEVEAQVALLEAEAGLRTLRTSPDDVRALSDFLAAEPGPWALVGSSGVGKTSLIATLLPEEEVGAVAAISDYWGVGRHTTTHSRLFTLPAGGEIADSPGIRNFTPVLSDPGELRLHFPGIGPLPCRYRDCLHRPDEDGCAAQGEVAAPLLESYRSLLAEVTDVHRSRPR